MLMKVTAAVAALVMMLQVVVAEQKPAEKSAEKTAAATAKAPATAKPAPKPLLLPFEQRVVDNTNAERAKYGLPPLMVDRKLVSSAHAHTAWMTNNNNLQHTSEPVAENIAMGQNSSGEVVQAWMNSSGHRANILNGSYSRIGVAAYRTPDGTIYWCQQFQP